MKKTDTKTRILSEALKLFAQEGYEAVNVEQIADAVTWAKELKDRYTVLWIWFDLYGEETENIV